jgi:hypothetical protein
MKKEVQDINDIDPYKVDKLSKVPSWLIVLILKYWAAAAAIYFIGMDTFIINWSESDNADILASDVDKLLYEISQAMILTILFGLFLAIFSNYIVRPFVRMMYNRRNNTYRYNMVNVKGFKSFLLSLLYNMPLSFLLTVVVVWLGYYHLILDPFGTTGGTGVEPFSYALVYIVVDAFFVLIKDIIVYIHQRIKYNRQMRSE